MAGRYSARRELAFVLFVYGIYLLVRKLVLDRDGRARANRNAERVVALEEGLGIHLEPAVQRAVLRFPRVLHGLNAGYAVFNVTLTLGWAAVLLRRGDPGYGRLRNACLLTHLGAQPVFLLFPTAPPRALEGFVDTMSEVSGLDLEHPGLVRLYNPVAAMPEPARRLRRRHRRRAGGASLVARREARCGVVPAARLVRHHRDREPLRARRGRRGSARLGRASDRPRHGKLELEVDERGHALGPQRMGEEER